MATRAQNFRAEEQRRTHNKPPQPKKSRGPSDPLHTATRNVTKRGAKNGQMKLEDSMSGRPSRKSTRRSLHHGRNDEQIQREARGRTHTPKSRAYRAQVQKA